MKDKLDMTHEELLSHAVSLESKYIKMIEFINNSMVIHGKDIKIASDIIDELNVINSNNFFNGDLKQILTKMKIVVDNLGDRKKLNNDIVEVLKG